MMAAKVSNSSFFSLKCQIISRDHRSGKLDFKIGAQVLWIHTPS